MATGANSEAVQAQFEQRFSASAGKLRETYGAESVAAFVEKGMSFYEERGERAKEVGEPILAETPAHAAIEHRLEEADARVEPKKVKKPRGKETPAPAAQKAPEPALPAMPTKQEEAVAFAQRVVPVISELKLNFGSVEEKTGFLSFAKEKIELIEESTPLLEGKKLESVLAGLYNTWKRESKGEGTSVAMK
ncbi:hypothetical protein HY992_00330 [Candidatus Micrarchaeota archaeon]|nr:hypothetical protein [Candidatus Micrarchaeota archaeon]